MAFKIKLTMAFCWSNFVIISIFYTNYENKPLNNAEADSLAESESCL